jgi:hypothetical protein
MRARASRARENEHARPGWNLRPAPAITDSIAGRDLALLLHAEHVAPSSTGTKAEPTLNPAAFGRVDPDRA